MEIVFITVVMHSKGMFEGQRVESDHVVPTDEYRLQARGIKRTPDLLWHDYGLLMTASATIIAASRSRWCRVFVELVFFLNAFQEESLVFHCSLRNPSTTTDRIHPPSLPLLLDCSYHKRFHRLLVGSCFITFSPSRMKQDNSAVPSETELTSDELLAYLL